MAKKKKKPIKTRTKRRKPTKAARTLKRRHARKPPAKSLPKHKVAPKATKPARPPGGKSTHAGKGGAPPAASDSKKGKGAAPPAAVDSKKLIRKGITIVAPRPMRRTAPKSNARAIIAAHAGRLITPGSPARKPLIPSGPGAPSASNLIHDREGEPPPKTPFGKKDLARFRAILVQKRAELAGDVSTMENEALKGQSGSLSNLPQHIAEQGSEAYEQSLSLDLAAADRKLIKEIDAALERITNGTYGVCELTGKPIRAERLEELPWARYSIEAARELERRSYLS